MTMSKLFSPLRVTLAALALGGGVLGVAHAQSKAPVYAVIDISETMDADAYIKAVSAAEPKASQTAGGRFIVRSNKAVALDGGAAPNRFVIIAFDNEEQARAWHTSVGEVNAVRLKATKSRSFLVEGLAN
jgi:uncharacterized protein (DUF1330 family)